MTTRVDLRYRKGTDRLRMSWETVRIIRDRRKAGETTRSIAADIGVTQQTVSLICNNRTWFDPNYVPPKIVGGKIVEPTPKRGRGRPRKNPPSV